MQVKERELATVRQERNVAGQALQKLEEDVDDLRTRLLKATEGHLGLPEALEDIRNLKVQMDNIRQARDTVILEVCRPSRACSLFCAGVHQLTVSHVPFATNPLGRPRHRVVRCRGTAWKTSASFTQRTTQGCGSWWENSPHQMHLTAGSDRGSRP